MRIRPRGNQAWLRGRGGTSPGMIRYAVLPTIAVAMTLGLAPAAHADTHYGGTGLYKQTSPASPALSLIRRDDGRIQARVNTGYGGLRRSAQQQSFIFSAGVSQSRVLRGRPLSSAAIWSSRSGCARPDRACAGGTGAAARWCSRCCRAATASAGRRSRPARRCRSVKAWWAASSRPWSQVSDLTRCAGSVWMRCSSASMTVAVRAVLARRASST